MQMASREIVRSVIFLIVFWTVVTLLFVGMYQLVNAIDITGIIGQLFGVK